MTTNELLKLKKQMQQTENELQQEKGAKIQLLKELKSLGFSNIKEAKENIIKLTNDINDLDKDMQDDLQIIQEALDNNVI